MFSKMIGFNSSVETESVLKRRNLYRRFKSEAGSGKKSDRSSPFYCFLITIITMTMAIKSSTSAKFWWNEWKTSAFFLVCGVSTHKFLLLCFNGNIFLVGNFPLPPALPPAPGPFLPRFAISFIFIAIALFHRNL